MNSLNNSENSSVINTPEPQKTLVETNFNYVPNASSHLSFEENTVHNLNKYLSSHHSYYPKNGKKNQALRKFLKLSHDDQVLHDIHNMLSSPFYLNQLIKIICKYDVLDEEWKIVTKNILESGLSELLEDRSKSKAIRIFIKYYLENHFTVDTCGQFYSFVTLISKNGVGENHNPIVCDLGDMVGSEFYLDHLMKFMFSDKHELSIEEWKSVTENILSIRSDKMTMHGLSVNENGVIHKSCPVFLSLCVN